MASQVEIERLVREGFDRVMCGPCRTCHKSREVVVDHESTTVSQAAEDELGGLRVCVDSPYDPMLVAADSVHDCWGE